MEAASQSGESPQAFVDRISQAFVSCWSDLDIQYDDFIRTTEPRHQEAVQALFSILQSKGFIYQDKYEGWYDVSSETFVKESDLVDGKSPDGNEVRWVSEDNYFFKLSAFEDRLLQHIQANQTFLLPESRKNEVVSFIKQGLRDICITRTNPGWGISVPGDEGKVVYVWFDALINYLSATGWPNSGWQELWPADVHWMAKEIFTRFHATLWPAMLMAADLPLPKTVIAHGWFTFGESKMSKSKGNALYPADLVSHFVAAGCDPAVAVDVVRFSLARSLPYEGDTNYTLEEVERQYNSDLANDLGNALNRSLSMAHKFCGGVVPDAPVEPEILEFVQDLKARAESEFEVYRLNEALACALEVVRNLNKYIDSRAPWALAKTNDPSLGEVIRTMLFCMRTAEGLIRPFMPSAADVIASQLNLAPLTAWNQIAQSSSLPIGTVLNEPRPIFPRLEIKQKEKEAPIPKPEKSSKEPKKAMPETPAIIEFPDFVKVQLKIGRIIEAEPIEKSEKLLKLQVMVGEEKRQILAGIKKKYSPIDLIGRQVVVVANLKPAKLMGEESQGMLLAADDVDGSPILLQPETEAPDGTSVH
jgi:methionyl-tRNA synthetase